MSATAPLSGPNDESPRDETGEPAEESLELVHPSAAADLDNAGGAIDDPAETADAHSQGMGADTELPDEDARLMLAFLMRTDGESAQDSMDFAVVPHAAEHLVNYPHLRRLRPHYAVPTLVRAALRGSDTFVGNVMDTYAPFGAALAAQAGKAAFMATREALRYGAFVFGVVLSGQEVPELDLEDTDSPELDPDCISRVITIAEGHIDSVQPLGDDSGWAVDIEGTAWISYISASGSAREAGPTMTQLRLPSSVSANAVEIVENWGAQHLEIRMEMHWLRDEDGDWEPSLLAFWGKDAQTLRIVWPEDDYSS